MIPSSPGAQAYSRTLSSYSTSISDKVSNTCKDKDIVSRVTISKNDSDMKSPESGAGQSSLTAIHMDSEKLLNLQARIRGYLYRTQYNPKVRHSTVENARKAVLNRTNDSLGKHFWGNGSVIYLTGKRDLKEGICISLYDDRHPQSKVATPHSTFIKETDFLSVQDITENWPLPEKLMAQKYNYQSLSFEGSQTTKVAPSLFKSLQLCPPELLRSMHERIAKADDLHLNCMDFVSLILYQEGIIPLRHFQQNPLDGFSIVPFNKSLDYSDNKKALEPGDLILIMNKQPKSLYHIAFCSSNSADGISIIGISNTTICPNVEETPMDLMLDLFELCKIKVDISIIKLNDIFSKFNGKQV